MGETLAVDQMCPAAAPLARAATVLKAGGVLVMPTDSVYGIGCAATPNNPAHLRIFAIKQRDRAQTLPWLVADAAALDTYGASVPAWARAVTSALWPGALTLVVCASPAVGAEYAAVDGSIALRVPASPLTRQLARASGGAMAVTSANTHGAPAAASGAAVEPGIVAAADLTLDAGPAPVGIASTVVDARGPVPRILRAGAVGEPAILAAADLL